MLESTQPTAGNDESGFYLLATFRYEFSDEVQEMLGLLNHPDEIAEVVEKTDDSVALKIRPNIPGL